MKFKKILSAVISAVMVAGCMAYMPKTEVFKQMTAEAVSYYSDPEKYGDYLYYQKFDKEWDGIYDYIFISDCDESATAVDIPSEIDGLPVTCIGAIDVLYNGAFEDCESLTSITIPDSVTKIGAYAFRGCTSLKSITIPDGVTKIGYYAFRGCTSLESITIPDSVTEIVDYAFLGCSRIKYVEIPETVETIGDEAFGYAYKYKSNKIDNFVVYGVSGTAAEEYALDHGMIFIDVNKPVSVSSKAFSLAVGNSQILTVNNYAGEVEWYSDNEDVATVSGGYVRAVSNGTANIYAIAGDEEFTIPVTVSDDPSVTDPDVTTTAISGTTSTTGTTVSQTTTVSGSTTGTTTPTEPSETLLGDANLDGKVNVRDCATIAKALASSLGDLLPKSADYNADGKINVRDAAAIAAALAKGEI